MFKIGEFSKLSNITIKMLRHYDEIGLLKPSNVDNLSGYRYYSASQLKTSSKINNYKSLGFSLKMIKILLEEEKDIETAATYMNLRKAEIEDEKEKLDYQLNMIKNILEKENNMKMVKYNVVQKTIPSRSVISLRKKVSTYNDEVNLWNELYEYLEKNQLPVIYDGYTMAIYHDKQYKDTDIDIEIQVTTNTNKDIAFLKTEKLNVLSVTFSGSYEQMPKVTEAIAYYIEQNNLTISGEMINIFHVSPAQTKNEDEWITEACYILEGVE